jgi:hypothetical protein
MVRSKYRDPQAATVTFAAMIACEDESEALANLAQEFGSELRSKFPDPRGATLTFAATIVREEVWRTRPRTGDDAVSLEASDQTPRAWRFLVLSVGLLALSAMAGRAGLIFMAILLGLGLASRAIWRVYLYQSGRSEGVGPAIRVLETVRRYMANEDPPQATPSRAD